MINIYYYAIDGDNIGAQFEKFALSNDISSIIEFSIVVKKLLNNIRIFFEEKNGEIVFCEGDSILIYSEKFIEVDNELLFNDDINFSMGIGNTCSNATLALKKAKGLGKKRIEVFINESQSNYSVL